MKTKKLTKKLIINKQTVANVNLEKVYGGGYTVPYSNCPYCHTLDTVLCPGC